MRILSIQLKNIKAHRHLDLEFSPGINVLSGPNGAGKSTIFEAIGYALFGVDAQSFVGNVERFISIGSKRGEITVVFTVDAQRFRVSRSVGAPARWLLAKELAGVFEVEEHKDNKETEARLKELLGLDNGRSLAEQFELVIGPFQNEFLGPFVIRQPSKRRDKFDEMLGIDAWRKTFSETNLLLKTIQNRIEVLAGALAPLRDQAAGLPEKRAMHLETARQLEQRDQEFKEKGQSLQALEAQLGEIDLQALRVSQVTVEIDRLKERIGNGKEKISSQHALIDEALQAHKIVVDNSAGKLACEEAAGRLVKLRAQVKVQRQLEREVAALDKQASTLAERYAAEARAAAETESQLHIETLGLSAKRRELGMDATLARRAESLPAIREVLSGVRLQAGQLEGRRAGLQEGGEKLAAGICPFFQEPCLNIAETPPGDLFSAKFAELAAQGERLQGELARLEIAESEAIRASDQIKRIEVLRKGVDEQAVQLAAKQEDNQRRMAGLAELQRQRTAAQQQLGELQQALQGYHHLQADIDAAEGEQKKHQTARDLYLAHQEQAARLAPRKAELAVFEQLLQELQGELLDKHVALAAASQDYDAGRHQALREQKDALRQEVGALGQKVEGLNADLARLAGEIAKLRQVEQEIAAKHRQIETYAEKAELVKFLRNRVFRNVSSFLSQRFREEISQRANRIYRIIAEVDEELYWGDDYRIVLRDMLEGELRERADDQLSGGQMMSAVVALRLAMLQSIGARIAFFDEPTSNLDATRRENLAHAFRAIDVGLEELTEHWYDQLFLISHDVAFTEVTDQIIVLE